MELAGEACGTDGMNLENLESLQTSAGQAALARAMELAPDESTFLSCFNRLSKSYPDDLARSALETALLRRRAREKFALADRMFFTREALEQSTGELVARHRARRFADFGLVGDFCCGVGGDAIALAGRGPIIAVDRDPLRLRLARLNLEVHGLAEKAEFLLADVLVDALPEVEAVFVDPDRRVVGRRRLSINECQPSLEALLPRLRSNLPAAVKLARASCPPLAMSRLLRWALSERRPVLQHRQLPWPWTAR
jgi:hypothetical protein